MKKNGFTLIELIAIILVLAAICLVSFPTILNMAKQNDKNTYEEYKKTICLAAKTYVTNENKITDQSEIIVSVKNLVDLDYIEDTLINPKTKLTAVEEDKSVNIIVNTDKSLECIYSE